MGGIWSTRLKKAEGGLSSSNTLGKGYGVGFAVHDRKIAKAYYDSMELRPTPGKDGASTAPQMTSILGRAGTVGLEKAVEVLDTIGSSMSNLTSASGFMSERVSRGNKICILSFEVANTITKGAALMRSVSQENLEFLKNKILLSDGIQKLVSMDMKELLAIVASDTREELDGFCKEVIRFGNLCKDPEWHNLARYFQKLFSDSSPPQLQKEDAEATMQHLTNLAQHTSDLYHEFHALDRFEQDYRSKLREEETLTAAQRGEHTMILQSELKRQRKLVKSLKKRSLWSRNLEEVMEKLVDIVAFIHQEILEGFGPTGINTANSREDPAPPRLGPSGLALHYANVIQQMDSIVSRPLSLPPNMRDSLYQGLPVSVKADLRSRLQTFRVKNEMTVAHIKAGMQKTLQWLVPMAESTVKAHQGFGWIGEWANMGADLNVKPCQYRSLIRIQTLHHADKERTDECILQLAVWLHHIAIQVKNRDFGLRKISKSLRYPCQGACFSHGTKQDPNIPSGNKPLAFQLSVEDREILETVVSERLVLGRSKSQGYIPNQKKASGWERSRSCSDSPCRGCVVGADSLLLGRDDVLDIVDGLDSRCPPVPTGPFYA